MLGLPAPGILLLGLVFVALAAVPTRRLGQAGLGVQALVAYLAILVALAFFVALGHGPDRLLVPVLVALYVAPFVAGPELLGRLVRRSRRPARRDGPPDGR